MVMVYVVFFQCAFPLIPSPFPSLLLVFGTSTLTRMKVRMCVFSIKILFIVLHEYVSKL